MRETIIQWHKHIFSCLFIDRAWNLSLRFLVWVILKERNNKIFKDQENSQEIIWEGIMDNIRETILSEKWHMDEWKAAITKVRILKLLNLLVSMIAPSSWKVLNTHASSPLHYTMPLQGFIKLIFHGASKGNP